MMNHALFAGLLYAGATPITEDPFHNQALSIKLMNASQIPVVKQILADRSQERQMKMNRLATPALTDAQLNLPV